MIIRYITVTIQRIAIVTSALWLWGYIDFMQNATKFLDEAVCAVLPINRARSTEEIRRASLQNKSLIYKLLAPADTLRVRSTT